MPDLIENPEDAKLVTLAKATRARTQVSQGAAVRDQDGRTYAAAEVRLPSLEVSALGLAVAMAVSSGAKSIEAAAVVSEHGVNALLDLGPVRDLAGEGVSVFLADPAGTVLSERHT